MKKRFAIFGMVMLTALSVNAKKKVVVEKDPAGQKITIGTIVYNWKDLDNQFKNLHEDGFTSCQLSYSKSFDAAFAAKVKDASQKYNIKVTTVVGVPGHSCWNFTQGPSTIGLVPTDGREEKLAVYRNMIDFCKEAGVRPCIPISDSFRKTVHPTVIKILSIS